MAAAIKFPDYTNLSNLWNKNVATIALNLRKHFIWIFMYFPLGYHGLITSAYKQILTRNSTLASYIIIHQVPALSHGSNVPLNLKVVEKRLQAMNVPSVSKGYRSLHVDS